MKKLTAKQEAFAREYVLNGGNASEAYRKCYNASNMKPETVHKRSGELLKGGKVRGRVKELQSVTAEVAEEKFNIDAEWVLREAVKMHRIASGEEDSHVVVRESIGDGMTETSSKQVKKTDVAGMGKALEIIGKHIDVSAFDKDSQLSVEVKVIDPFKKDEA